MTKLFIINKNNFLKIPNVRQSNDYSCGVACLMSILAYYDKFDGNENDLGKKLKTTYEEGTEPDNIVKVAKEYGLKSYIKEHCTIDDLKKFVENKIPVIISYQAWTNRKRNINWQKIESDGHYSVLIGIDDDKVYFSDPSLLNKIGFLSIKELMDRWHDEGYERMCIIVMGNKKENIEKFEKIK